MEPRQVLGVDEIDLSDIEFWQRPIDEREGAFKTLRETRPIAFFEEPELPPEVPLPRGPGYWSLTRHADILHVSRTPEIFASGKGVNINDMPPIMLEFFGSMINMDDPRHARLRRIVSRGFTPRMLRKLEGYVEVAARRVVDDVMDKSECDFVAEIASPLPLWIICDMMGIAESDRSFVFERSNTILGLGDPDYTPEGTDFIMAAMTAGSELNQLLQDLAKFRKANPEDDLTSLLVNAEIDGDRLTDQEIGSFFVLLTVAGNETTRNAISHGMKALHDHPAQRKIWAEDFEGVSRTAVEEIVRWASPVMHFRRTATRDTEISGQKIREGEKVVMWYSSGNRDEAVFEDAFVFDVRRTPNEHVGFGGPGPHFCLGAHLARREIRLMFRELFARLPNLEITGPPELLASNFIHGVKRMPCAIGRPG